MHHVVLGHWSRGSSFLHSRDARAKTAALAAFLIAIATAPANFEPLAALCLATLVAALMASGIPVAGAMRRAAMVLPFSLMFAAMSWMAGDQRRAVLLVEKSYLSALAALTLAATTPMPQLLRGLESLGVPRFLLMVAQFLYRYLFVISEQAQHVRLAGLSRGGFHARAAAGALAVMFARSYERADRIYRSMIARGFDGRIPSLTAARFGLADGVFVAATVAALAAVRGWL